MPGLSASQEMQLEYVTWSAPDLPPVAIRRPAMEGIHREVNDTFASAPHRGAGLAEFCWAVARMAAS